MQRAPVYTFIILYLSSLTLYAEEISSYNPRVDFRLFQPLPNYASVPDFDLLHPGAQDILYSFLPALENQSLYLLLSPDRKTEVQLSLLQSGTLDLELPAGEEGQTLQIIIPEDDALVSMRLPRSSEYFTDKQDRASHFGSVFLDQADTLVLTLPEKRSNNPDIQSDLQLTIANSETIGIEVHTDQEVSEKFYLSPFEGKRTFQFPIPPSDHPRWTLSPLSDLNSLDFRSVLIPEFPEPLNREGIQILKSRIEDWRNNDFEIYSWSSFPEILILDCLDYDVQDRFFRRLAYFVEKNGYKGNLLTNQQLQGKHGWNAHDYRPSDLAEFYNRVKDTDFEIYPEEALLRSLLLKQGVLKRNADGNLKAGTGAVLSLSRESPPVLRDRFFVHEGSHGIYFVSEEYRDFIYDLWASLDDDDRSMWRFFLGWYGYDPGDEDLMINEFQAYLLQQKTFEAPVYFGPRMGNLMHSYPAQEKYLSRGTGPESAGFQVWAEVIEEWIMKKWGLRAGNFSPLHKELP